MIKQIVVVLEIFFNKKFFFQIEIKQKSPNQSNLIWAFFIFFILIKNSTYQFYYTLE